uniref:Uncharacterized protein n=1 Tax=Chromera velia CCMP2878 TaxID=1169474 RepID=A0A0G4IFW6_9ALVE|eukprot:Cvel_14131.t1-p1 / transcript=Cvel_14131.t1 / gene=Cvel_14131 / organism=Chromera_velia_CCMP2878 / gene_product=hypothetical protein / transcript_product=hypothetical protein / location=Cvel_scaffold995:47562-51190(+) / protein_length=628 / sequence_SO=supercontig / SO=protein_coding / is_pseudo=false
MKRACALLLCPFLACQGQETAQRRLFGQTNIGYLGGQYRGGPTVNHFSGPTSTNTVSWTGQNFGPVGTPVEVPTGTPVAEVPASSDADPTSVPADSAVPTAEPAADGATAPAEPEAAPAIPEAAPPTSLGGPGSATFSIPSGPGATLTCGPGGCTQTGAQTVLAGPAASPTSHTTIYTGDNYAAVPFLAGRRRRLQEEGEIAEENVVEESPAVSTEDETEKFGQQNFNHIGGHYNDYRTQNMYSGPNYNTNNVWTGNNYGPVGVIQGRRLQEEQEGEAAAATPTEETSPQTAENVVEESPAVSTEDETEKFGRQDFGYIGGNYNDYRTQNMYTGPNYNTNNVWTGNNYGPVGVIQGRRLQEEQEGEAVAVEIAEPSQTETSNVVEESPAVSAEDETEKFGQQNFGHIAGNYNDYRTQNMYSGPNYNTNNIWTGNNYGPVGTIQGRRLQEEQEGEAAAATRTEETSPQTAENVVEESPAVSTEDETEKFGQQNFNYIGGHYNDYRTQNMYSGPNYNTNNIWTGNNYGPVGVIQGRRLQEEQEGEAVAVEGPMREQAETPVLMEGGASTTAQSEGAEKQNYGTVMGNYNDNRGATSNTYYQTNHYARPTTNNYNVWTGDMYGDAGGIYGR